MKENTNEMILVFDSIPVNEGLARVTAASFCMVQYCCKLGSIFQYKWSEGGGCKYG